MNRHFITVLLLIEGIACYVVGAAVPSIVFIVLGGIAELSFWLRIFGRKRAK